MTGLVMHVTSEYWSMLNTSSGSSTSQTAVQNCLYAHHQRHRFRSAI